MSRRDSLAEVAVLSLWMTFAAASGALIGWFMVGLSGLVTVIVVVLAVAFPDPTEEDTP